MQKKDFLPKLYLAKQNFPHLKNCKYFFQIEINTLFPILRPETNQHFQTRVESLPNAFNKKKVRHDEEIERMLECKEELGKKSN